MQVNAPTTANLTPGQAQLTHGAEEKFRPAPADEGCRPRRRVARATPRLLKAG